MPVVSARYTELAGKSKRELDAVFAQGSPPDVTALTGNEFRGYNQPRATALLGIRKFIKAFYTDASGRTFGCNTPVTQNGLDAEWLARPSAERPKRYAFFRVEAADPGAPDGLRRGAAPAGMFPAVLFVTIAAIKGKGARDGGEAGAVPGRGAAVRGHDRL